MPPLIRRQFEKPDLDLLRQGLKLLREKYPDSLRIASGEVALFSDVDENPKAAFAAMKRMNGTLDMNVWYSSDAYDGAVRWVTWKNSK